LLLLCAARRVNPTAAVRLSSLSVHPVVAEKSGYQASARTARRRSLRFQLHALRGRTFTQGHMAGSGRTHRTRIVAIPFRFFDMPRFRKGFARNGVNRGVDAHQLR
jgi:hypothetical protein